MTERNRPTNVTALAVLALCFGLTFLLGAAIGSVVGLGIGEAMGADNGVATLPEAITLASFAIVSISSVLYLAFGLAALLSYRSAWRFGIAGAVLALTSVVVALVGGIVGDTLGIFLWVGFAGAMLFSLLRVPSTRVYFGR